MEEVCQESVNFPLVLASPQGQKLLNAHSEMLGAVLLVPETQQGLGRGAEQHTATTRTRGQGSMKRHTHIKESVILSRKCRTQMKVNGWSVAKIQGEELPCVFVCVCVWGGGLSKN